ncbi:hypothetical protein GGF46_003939 [Coemansia sp. RSA 552]|nr:hypothetical protein GGF46_003939 [Coemansia sp. RSA 552]
MAASGTARQLRAVPQDTHAQNVVGLAKQVLFLRTTTQIDELMKRSSTAVQQRWDFLGPATDPSKPPGPELFSQIDKALQWTADSAQEIGQYIRHAHFALELTEEQAETLCPAHVRYSFVDRNTIHAHVPFAGQGDWVYNVVLVWEDGKWVYFDTSKTAGSSGHVTVEAAIGQSEAQHADVDSDDADDYWGQYGDSDSESEGEGEGGSGQPKEKHSPAAEPPLQHGLAADCMYHALAAAGSAAVSAGVSKDEFLALAAGVYSRSADL